MQDSPWLVQLDRQAPFALTITGPGRVEADVPGLECGRVLDDVECRNRADADADPARERSSCAGRAPAPAFRSARSRLGRLGGDGVLRASAYRLSVRVSGGAVRGPSAGIRCPGRCASSVSSHVPLRLTASRQGLEAQDLGGSMSREEDDVLGTDDGEPEHALSSFGASASRERGPCIAWTNDVACRASEAESTLRRGQ